jgi:hypothetical protein
MVMALLIMALRSAVRVVVIESLHLVTTMAMPMNMVVAMIVSMPMIVTHVCTSLGTIPAMAVPAVGVLALHDILFGLAASARAAVLLLAAAATRGLTVTPTAPGHIF